MGKSKCGGCGSCSQCVKIKVKKEKAKGFNLVVVSPQAVTSNTSTLLQFSNGTFTFNNMCELSCYPCGPSSLSPNYNPNIFCIKCAGVYNLTAKIILDTVPGAYNVYVAVDISGHQAMYDVITGQEYSLTLANNFNLCKHEQIQFRIYSSNALYVGNVIAGNVSLVRVSRYISC